MLQNHFVIFTSLCITHYHFLKLKRERPGVIRAKKFTTSDTFFKIKLHKETTGVEHVRKTVRLITMDLNLCVNLEDLLSVRYEHEGNRRAYFCI